MREIYVYEVMTQDVTTCSAATSLKEVVGILSSKRLSSLIIINDDAYPIGIITERDMVAILADMLNDVIWDNLSINHFMTSPTYTIGSDAPLHDAVEFSQDKEVRHLPVVGNDNKLVGLLTQTDMVNGLSRITHL